MFSPTSTRSLSLVQFFTSQSSVMWQKIDLFVVKSVTQVERIDENTEYSDSLYEYYVRYLYLGLQQMPEGTKVATYHSFHGEIPVGYELVDSYQNGDLNFWIRK